jgi:hypothetical protein
LWRNGWFGCADGQPRDGYGCRGVFNCRDGNVRRWLAVDHYLIDGAIAVLSSLPGARERAPIGARLKNLPRTSRVVTLERELQTKLNVSRRS